MVYVNPDVPLLSQKQKITFELIYLLISIILPVSQHCNMRRLITFIFLPRILLLNLKLQQNSGVISDYSNNVISNGTVKLQSNMCNTCVLASDLHRMEMPLTELNIPKLNEFSQNTLL